MLDRQDLAEGAPYELPDHGRVRVTFVDEADGLVYYERIATDGPRTPMHKAPIDDFRRRAEPLPVIVSVPTTDITCDTNW